MDPGIIRRPKYRLAVYDSIEAVQLTLFSDHVGGQSDLKAWHGYEFAKPKFEHEYKGQRTDNHGAGQQTA